MDIFREQGMTNKKDKTKQYDDVFKGVECRNSLYIFTKVYYYCLLLIMCIDELVAYSVLQAG